MMKKLLLAALISGLAIGSAFAQTTTTFTGKDAGGTTKTFQGWVCPASTICGAAALTDTLGAAFGTAANPMLMGFGSGVTLPAFGATPTFNFGTLNGAATAANQSTGNTSLGTIATNSGLPIPDCTATPCTNKIGNVYLVSQYPAGATPITGNATGTTGAVVGTLAGASSVTTFICGFDVSAIGGTAAIGPITVAGLVGSSMVFQLASAASGVTLSRSFSPCVPASAVNTAITITTTADGTATAVDVNSWGYRL
jgi:hypothetical protein